MAINNVKNIVRVGLVSSVDYKAMTARVVFTGKEDTISGPLPILNRGSQFVRDYWTPDIGEQVVCLFIVDGSGRGFNEGFILGTFFNDTDAPPVTGEKLRRVDFGDGSYIEHDAKSGNLTIHARGAIKITGARIDLN